MISKRQRLKISLALNWKIEIDQMKKTFISTQREFNSQQWNPIFWKNLCSSTLIPNFQNVSLSMILQRGNPFHQHKKYSEDTCRLKRLVITWYVKEITQNVENILSFKGNNKAKRQMDSQMCRKRRQGRGLPIWRAAQNTTGMYYCEQ